MNLDAYVVGPGIEETLNAISSMIGELTLVENIEDFQFFDAGQCRLTVHPGESGFFWYSLVGCEKWQTDVEFARFLADATGRRVRCSPGKSFPQVDPHSDFFLQIEKGHEELIVWEDDENA